MLTISVAARASLSTNTMRRTLLLRPSSLATAAFTTTTTTTTTNPTIRRRRLLRRRAVNPEATMAGTVKLYDRHVFVLDPVRGHELWPTHVEESSFLLIADYKKAQKALTAAAGAAGTVGKMFTLKFTVAEALGHALAAPSDEENPAITFKDHGLHTVLLFSPTAPSLAIRGLTKADIPTLVKLLVTKENYSAALPSALPSQVIIQPLPGKDLFVCAHASRDIRCKTCGPRLVGWLKEEAIKAAKSGSGEDEVRIWPSSHVGGHMHAGNVLVFPSGDWYGQVNDPAKAQLVLEKKGVEDDLKKLWRGRIGLNQMQQDELVSEGN